MFHSPTHERAYSKQSHLIMAPMRKSRGGGGRQTNIPELDEETCPICLETLARKVKGGRAVRSSFAPSKELGGVVILDCGHGFCKIA
jgi:hypothetical protein